MLADQAILVARGVASAVSTDGRLTAVQASLLTEVTEAVLEVRVDLTAFEPLEPEALGEVMDDEPEEARRRVVHLMVLAELILRPIPLEVAIRVGKYAEALGAKDQFVRIAHRYAQGGFGLAWIDLHQHGFAEHWENARTDQLKTSVKLENQLALGVEDGPLAQVWNSFQDFPPRTLGRMVWDMYRGRGFALPGSIGGASAYLAQHDFVHVLADYGTNLPGELETFSLIGRADPDPKGFAWVATLIGLFDTGYIDSAGFFDSDPLRRPLESPAMHVRFADALRRGRVMREQLGTDLLEVDYHKWADQPIDAARRGLGFTPKSEQALTAGSPGLFEAAGMTRTQLRYAASIDS